MTGQEVQGITYTEVGKNMSLSKSKLFLAVVLIVSIALAIPESASALEGARFWKPYQAEQFGGNRRDRDGLYADIEMIWWAISAPNGNYIGSTDNDGNNDTRWTYNGSRESLQSNSMNSNMFDLQFSMGTRVEVGNRKGHHGWLFSGYGLPAATSTVTQENASMVIRDSETLTLYPSVKGGSNDTGYGYGTLNVWNAAALTGRSHLEGNVVQPQSAMIQNVGYLWGFFPNHYHPTVVWDHAVIAPLPITFNSATITNRSLNYSLELMYTYRAHPFKWGGLEILAGARYWHLDDQFKFFGTGPLPVVDVDDDSSSTTVTTTYYQQNANAYGPVSVLADLSVNARGLNRIIGPQIGAKITRKNQRWTFGFEGRFLAGINNQMLTTNGTSGSNLGWNYDMGTWPELDSSDTTGDLGIGEQGDATISEGSAWQGVYPWIPVGALNNTTAYSHKRTQTFFSPVVELRLDAAWQWTDAVSVTGGFTTMFADNIARGVMVNDYRINPDSSIFGIRSAHNSSILVYGVNLGLQISR